MARLFWNSRPHKDDIQPEDGAAEVEVRQRIRAGQVKSNLKLICEMSANICFVILIFTAISCEESILTEKSRAPKIISLIASADSVETLSSVEVHCYATDPDDDSLKYVWTENSDVLEEASASLLWRAPRISGYYSITCTVSDNRGNTDSKTISLRVFGHDHLVEYTTIDTNEAKEFALWFSGQLTPPDSLFKELLWSINYLRHVHGTNHPVVKNNRFFPPWVIGDVALCVYDTTAQQIENGIYPWSLLPDSLKPHSFEGPNMLGFLLLSFEKLYHPRRLSDIYEKLPGIKWAEPSGIIHATITTFPLFPGITDNSLTYLFVYGKLTDGPYYYYKYINNEPVFLGSWNITDPEFPEEAKQNINNFSSWDGY